MEPKQLYIPLVPPVEITKESLTRLHHRFLELHPDIRTHRHDVNTEGEFIVIQVQAQFLKWVARELEKNKFADGYDQVFGKKRVELPPATGHYMQPNSIPVAPQVTSILRAEFAKETQNSEELDLRYGPDGHYLSPVTKGMFLTWMNARINRMVSKGEDPNQPQTIKSRLEKKREIGESVARNVKAIFGAVNRL